MLPLYMKDGEEMIASTEVHQYIPQSTPYAREATYMGKRIAELTNMTPFTRGQYVPVLVPSADASHSRVAYRGATHQDTLAARQAPRQMMKRPTEEKTAFSGVRDAGMVFGTYGETERIVRDPSSVIQQAARGYVQTARARQAGAAAGSQVGAQDWYKDTLEAAPSIIDAIKGTDSSTPQVPAPSTVAPPSVSSVPQAKKPTASSTPWIVLGVVGVASAFLLYKMAKNLQPDEVKRPFRRTL